jgi:hypothetical protein
VRIWLKTSFGSSGIVGFSLILFNSLKILFNELSMNDIFSSCFLFRISYSFAFSLNDWEMDFRLTLSESLALFVSMLMKRMNLDILHYTMHHGMVILRLLNVLFLKVQMLMKRIKMEELHYIVHQMILKIIWNLMVQQNKNNNHVQ